jgi:hypothetical protein
MLKYAGALMKGGLRKRRLNADFVSVEEVAFPPVPIRVAGLLSDDAPNQYFCF